MKINRILIPSVAAGVATFFTFSIAHADPIYVSDAASNEISILNGTSVTSFGSPALDEPTGVAFDPTNGNLYVANSGDGTVSEFTPGGMLVNADVSSGLGDAEGMTFDSAGDLFVVSKSTGNIYEISAGGTQSIYATDVTGINDVAFDKSGNLFVSTGSDNGITVITPGKLSSALTVNGPKLNGPDGLAFDANGNLYVVNDFDPSVEKITSGSTGSTLVNGTGLDHPRGIVFANGGADIFVADESNNTVTEYNALTGALVYTYTGLPCGPSFLADPSGSLPVPEPSTYAMLMGGLVAVYFMNRRRQLARI